MIFPSLVTLLTLMLYQFFSINVSRARGTYAVKAPATTGNLEFERRYRVQMNTLEQMIVMLPSLWLFGLVWAKPNIGAAIGGVWIIGQALYAMGYYKAAEKRYIGFLIATLSSSVLLLGSLAGIVRQLMIIYHVI